MRVFNGLSTPHMLRSPLAQPGGISPRRIRQWVIVAPFLHVFTNHQDVEAAGRFNVIPCRVSIGGTLGEIAHSGVLSAQGYVPVGGSLNGLEVIVMGDK